MKVENRHKVEIVLIPNKYLETPHYKLERIKHDDPRLEEPQVSYKLAERSEVDMSFSKRQERTGQTGSGSDGKKHSGRSACTSGSDIRFPHPEEDKGFFDKLLGFLGLGSKEAILAEASGKPVKTGRKGKPANVLEVVRARSLPKTRPEKRRKRRFCHARRDGRRRAEKQPSAQSAS